MLDEEKSREQLLNELLEIRQRITKLEKSGSERDQTEKALRESETKLRTLLSSMVDLVFGFDQECRFVFYHSQIDQKLFVSPDKFIGKTPAEILPPHLNGLITIAFEENKKNKISEFEYWLNIDSEILWFSAKMSPIFLDNEFKGSVAVVRDVSERKWAEEQIRRQTARWQALAKISKTLSQVSKDSKAVLDLMAQYCAEFTKDACVIHFLSDNEEWLNPTSFYYPKPEIQPILKDLLATVSYHPTEGLISQVLTTAHPLLISPVTSEQLLALTKQEYWPLTEQFDIQSILIIPLQVWNKVIGTISLYRDKSNPPYTKNEQIFLKDLADQAALAIAHARLLAANQREINERKQAEEKVKTLYSLQLVISEINESLLRIKNEQELLQRICELLQCIEYIKFVWIGFVDKENLEVKPVAQAGFEGGYLSSVNIIWEDTEFGRGPTNMALRTRQPFIINDIENDNRYGAWKEEALKRDYASSITLPLIDNEELVGVLNVFSEKKDVFEEQEVWFLMQVASDIAIGLRTLMLEKELGTSIKNLQELLTKTVNAIALMCETRDPYTAGHARRVTQLASAIAKQIGLSEIQIEGIHIAGLLHDIGKLVVPSEILSKPGKLNEYEFNIIRTHAQVGFNILKEIEFPWPVAQAVLQHHERLNGSGYPSGLKGDQIILEAKILAVADVVEAMSSHRPYRSALGIEKALEEITNNKDILYDSQIVAACLKLFKEKIFSFNEYKKQGK